MKPVTDNSRFHEALDTIRHEIKSIDWKDFKIYPIIGLVAIMAFIVFFYLQG